MKNAPAKEMRPDERKRLGKLRNQVVSQCTESKCQEAFEVFRIHGGLTASFVIESGEEFDGNGCCIMLYCIHVGEF